MRAATDRIRRRTLVALAALALLAVAPAAADPLPSWRDGAPKRAILAFVAAAVREGGPGFVAPAERIAVFDNDGTLWAEQPIYFQLAFALDRVKALAPSRPEWKTQEPFAAVLLGDVRAVLGGGEQAVAGLVMATHSGVTTDEFASSAAAWLVSARHPRFARRYDECVYQPMLELLAYLRANGFATWIVSGGGVEFLRVFSERVYGIPPQQVIGSSGKLRYEVRPSGPVLVKEPALDFVDDGPGKPVGIQRQLGRRPVLAFGNSDGDHAMLQWTSAGSGPRFVALVHHTDAAREWAYDHPSKVGQLDAALREARARGWTVVDMAKDWARVFPFEAAPAR